MNAKKSSAPAASVRVKLTAGWAGKSDSQVKNLRALGLRRSGDVRELPDTADIRGKIEVVKHLVHVESVK